MGCVASTFECVPGESGTLELNLVTFDSLKDCKDPFTISSNVARKISVELPANPTNLTFFLEKDSKQIITITTGDATNIDTKWFIISDDVGTVGFFIDLDDVGASAPAGLTAQSPDRIIVIDTIITGDDSTDVATKVSAVIGADSEFSSTFVLNVITVTDDKKGVRDEPNAGDTGWAFVHTFAGQDVIVELRSVEELGYLKIDVRPTETLLLRNGSVIVTHDALGDGTIIKKGIAGNVIQKIKEPEC